MMVNAPTLLQRHRRGWFWRYLIGVLISLTQLSPAQTASESPQVDPLAGITGHLVTGTLPLNRDVPFSAAQSHTRRVLAIRRGERVETYDTISGRSIATFAVNLAPDLMLYSLSATQRLALVHGRGAHFQLMDLASDENKLQFAARRARWCGDRHVAFDAYPGTGELRYFDAAMSEVTVRTVELLDPESVECVKRQTCGTVHFDGFHADARAIASPRQPWKDPALYVVDLMRVRVEKRIALPGPVDSLSVSPDDRHFAVVVNILGGPNRLLLIDANGGRIRSIERAPLRAVHAWHRPTGRLYLGGNGDLAVVEMKPEPRIVKRLSIGHHFNAHYRGILFDPSSRYGYVTEPYRMRLHVVDTETLEVVDTRPTEHPLSGMLVSQAVGVAMAYVTGLPYE